MRQGQEARCRFASQKKERTYREKSKRHDKNPTPTRSSSISDQYSASEMMHAPLSATACTQMQAQPSSSHRTPQSNRRSTACAKLLVRAGLSAILYMYHAVPSLSSQQILSTENARSSQNLLTAVLLFSD